MTDEGQLQHPVSGEEDVETTEESKIQIIRCGGLLNIGGAAQLHDQLCQAASFQKTILLDLSDPERIDTAGIQLLYSFIKHCEGNGISLQWRNVPPAAYSTAEQLGLEGLLKYLPPA